MSNDYITCNNRLTKHIIGFRTFLIQASKGTKGALYQHLQKEFLFITNNSTYEFPTYWFCGRFLNYLMILIYQIEGLHSDELKKGFSEVERSNSVIYFYFYEYN